MLPVSMSSLPIPTGLPDPADLSVPHLSMPEISMPELSSSSLAKSATGENARGEGERFLLQAFRSFSEAADSLERSYGSLRSEVVRLRSELEHSNAGLASSLEENRRMRERLDNIVGGLPCGVLVVESGDAISLLNPEGRRLLRSIVKLTSEEGVEFLSSVPGELHDLFHCARCQGGEHEQCFAGGTAEEIWLAVRHAAVTDEDASAKDVADKDKSKDKNKNKDMGTETSAVSDGVSIFILRDISEAKRLLREKDKQRREQALAEMSAVLAHEIRNPLGSLELFAGLLAGAALPRECRGWVEHVQAGLRTLAATVNNVLHFHSLPAPQRVATDLGALLDWAGGFLVPVAHQARVELCMRNHLHGVWFAADRHRLEQVLLNLVLNALRAMPGGGWVEISGQTMYRGEAVSAAISVSDTGPGFAQESANRIFEPGFSTRPGSPGLGLAVCRKIAEQHGGTLVASNRARAGANFTMTFPLEQQAVRGKSDEVAG